MANNLIFPIGFDLETAVKNAEREGQAAIERLDKIFSRQPLALRMDNSGFEKYSSELSQNIDQLKTRLKDLVKEFDAIPLSQKWEENNGVKTLTTDAKRLWDELLRITEILKSVGQGAQQMANQSIREIDKEIAALEKLKQKEIEARQTKQNKQLQTEWNAAADQHKRDLLAEEKRLQEENNRIRKEAETIAQREAEIEKLVVEYKLRQTQAQQAKKKASDEDYANLVKQLREEERLSAEKARQKALDMRRERQAEATAAIERERAARRQLFEAKRQQMLEEQRIISSQSMSYDALIAKLQVWQNIQNRSEVGSKKWEAATVAIRQTKEMLALVTDEMTKSERAAERMRKLREVLSANEKTLTGLNAKLAEYNSRIQGLEAGSAKFNKTALEIRRLTEELQKATQQMQDFQQKSFQGLSDSLTKGKVQALTQLREQLRQIEADYNRLNQTGAAYNPNGGLTTAANDILRQREAIIKQINQMLSTAADAQIQREKEINRVIEQRKAKADAIAAKRKSEQAAIQANINKLKEERRILNQQESSVAAITAKLQIQQQRLQSAKFGSDAFNKAAKEVERLSKKLDEAKQKIDNLTGRTQSAASAQSAAVRQVSQEFQAQDGYVSRLLKRMAVYAGYSMATNFLTSIREVTAQFELQRISLGAIIQDQQKANQIFAEIKSFALTSPLKVLDLTKYAKQVAAYGFEADRIFDATKRLADISVGLGVDMGRLTLAVSQIRAATVLKSSELRQLTETGLPMLDLLSKKLTETQGKLVSAADVMDLISKRAISYEMVEEILYDLTDAGGMFYNMQVKQSQTLFGMWSKLGDAAAIMYDQIGNTSTVNAGMKTTMGLLESMMRNWKTTARVLDTVSIALAVYVIGLKNAAVASTAMTTTEAARLAITNRQIIATPKLIAAIIGQNTATKLSTTLTKAHTVAMLNQSTATNVLSRGFWKLTAAMLANPWVAAAAGIALVVTALIHFIGNTETAAERAEKLNNSVASLKNLEDTTKPLIDIYNELINKTERTAEEQKKLSEVTHELAKQYPGAITAIGNFGEEVDLAADKLNKLYQAEKQARMDNTRFELEQTEKKIKEVEAEIEKYQQQLASGEKTIYKRLGDSGLRTKKVVPLTEEDKGNILKRIDELRYGEDGQSGLFGLQQSAEAARRALGLIPSEAAQAVEKFGAWKKTFTTFQQQVGQTKVRLFDESTINQFGSLEEALKKTAEEYKKNIALVATYDEVLKSTTLTAEERAKIEGERAEADAMANLAEKALKYYNAMSLLNTSTSSRGTKSDNRLQNLQEIERTLTSINKKYEELAKTEGNTAALEYVRKNYDSTLKYINKLGEQFNLNFAMPTDFKDLQSYRKAIQGVIEQLKMKGYEKAAIELELKIAEGNQAQLQKEIQAKLKALADRISRTKTAKEFYEKILSQTGDVELATRVSLSIYGSTGEELFEDTVAQIREVFKSGNKDVVIDLEPVFDMTNQRIDYKMLADIYERYQDSLIASNKETAKKIAQEGQKEVAANIANWQKELAKAKDFEQQRTDIIRTAAAEREKIIKEVRDPEERERLLNLSREKESQDLSKLNFEEFTKSEDYIKIFENLDNTATSTLKRLRTELQALIDTNKDLSPENMKTLVKAMEDIDEQIGERNPWESMVSSVKNYMAAIKSARIARDELAKAEAEYAAQEPQLKADIETAKGEKATADADVEAAEQALLVIQTQMAELRAQEIVDETALMALKQQEIVAENKLVDAKSKQNQAEANVKGAVQKQATAYKKVTNAQKKVNTTQDGAKKSQNDFLTGINNTKVAVEKVQGAMESLEPILGDLVAEGSVFGDAWNAVLNAMSTFTAIMEVVIVLQETFNIVSESNPWMAIAAAVLAVTAALAGFIGAQKVKKANKEIEHQQELLDQLEYTYGRLEKAEDKAFGADFVANQKQQQKILLAQQQAYMKQYEAEMSKGKKADKEKAQEFLDKARDVGDQIADMQGKIAEQMAGTDVASAARDFASAWLEAYASFGNTTDAIREKFNDMIKNMIVESVMAKTVQMALQPMFDEMDKMYKSGASMTDVLSYAFSKAGTLTDQISNGLEVNAKYLESLGINIRDLYASSDNLKGIAKEVGSASSEEINQLSAFVNTALYYVSPIPTISENVSLIRQLMERGTTSTLPDTTAAGWTDWQQQAMDNYNAIARNTADTVVECRRAAVACEAATEKLNRALRTKGATSGFNVFLNS